MTQVPREPAKALALLEEVQALVTKNAVTRGQGEVLVTCYSTFFLTAKMSEEWRPIINLKPLNHLIKPLPCRKKHWPQS